MKVLIVSDTHGKEGNLKEAMEREKPFDMLVHCGDVEGSEERSGKWQAVRSTWWREIMIFSAICPGKMNLR